VLAVRYKHRITLEQKCQVLLASILNMKEDSQFNNDEVKFIRYIVYTIQSFRGIVTG
jgi:hypothetical protein